MAVDSLVRLAPFRGKSIFLLAMFFIACVQVQKEFHPAEKLNAASISTSVINGRIHIHGVPYTGELYGLYEKTSDTEFVSHYINGLEDGEWRQFYVDKKLKEQRYYLNGKKVGEMKRWWENGRLQMLYRFENDEYEGTCSEWNPKGILVRELNYHRGHEEGSQRQWYDNGSVRSNYVIKNGRRFGLLGTKNCVNVADSIAFDK